MIQNVVVSPAVEKPDFVKIMIRKDSPVLGVFLICIRNNSQNLLELIHFTEIKKPIYRWSEFVVVGIADGRKDGTLLIVEMVKQFAASGRAFCEFKNFWLGDTWNGQK